MCLEIFKSPTNVYSCIEFDANVESNAVPTTDVVDSKV